MESPMKSLLWIVPVVLAAGFGVLIIRSNTAVKNLEKQLEETKRQVENSTNRSGASAGGQDPKDTTQTGGSRSAKGGKIDWSAFSGILEQFNEGADSPALDDMYDKFLTRMESMTTSELYAALDEIGALGLNPIKQSALEAEAVEFLMEKDPEGTLSRFDDRIGNDDDVGWILAEALGYMADRDPAAAVRWMDDKIKAGKFMSKTLDGYSEARIEYESILMSRILGSTNGQASDRVKELQLPETDRLDVLEQMDLTELSPSAQSEYVKILRELVPEDDREGAFGYVASELVYEGGFEAVDAFMKRVNATPVERSEAASEAALGKMLAISEERAVTAGDVDQLRTWLQGNVPAEVDQLTGEAIGEAYEEDGYFDYEQSEKLALQYHESTGNDEVLAGFLRSYAAMENPREAGKLLNRIKDGELRQQLARELKE